MIPPPHFLFSAYFVVKLSCSEFSAASSSGFTPVRHTHVAVFWCTNAPRRPLPLTIAYATPILWHRAGSHITSSRGSTSFAIRTSFAFLRSTSFVTLSRPYFTTRARFSSTGLPSAFALAAASRRAFFSASVSGAYLLIRRNTSAAWFLSNTWLNWFTVGGTFRRWLRILRCLWMIT